MQDAPAYARIPAFLLPRAAAGVHAMLATLSPKTASSASPQAAPMATCKPTAAGPTSSASSMGAAPGVTCMSHGWHLPDEWVKQVACKVLPLRPYSADAPRGTPPSHASCRLAATETAPQPAIPMTDPPRCILAVCVRDNVSCFTFPCFLARAYPHDCPAVALCVCATLLAPNRAAEPDPALCSSVA